MSADPLKGGVRTRQVCTFWVNGFLFGIPATLVQEVIRFQPLTPVPLAPATVSGLINLRGQIVTTLNLRRMLDFTDGPQDAQPMNVVVRVRDSAVSLQVDEVGDVLDVDEGNFEAPPQTLLGRARTLLRGVYKLEGKLILMIDPDMVTRAELLNVDPPSQNLWKPAARRVEHAQ